MRTFRFLHSADLHLDSPLRGLEADPDAPADAIRGATRAAFANLIDHAIGEKIDFVVAAGDLYDGDWQDWRTGRFLIAQIKRLSDAGIPFIAIRGNHDAASVITNSLRMPSNIAWLLDHRRPETIRLPNLAVSIHGQSFANKSVTENLAALYPAPDPNRFNIGLLHSSIDGREGHDDYAPCSVAQLRDHGYDYWALGHIHQREIVHEAPWIVFPGNPQGRHIRETGPKGAILVTVRDGIVESLSDVPLDVVRWAHLEIVLCPETTEDGALNEIRTALANAARDAEPRLLAVRLTLTGACAAHAAFSRDLGVTHETIRAVALEVAEPGAIWIETINPRTTAPAAAGQSGATGKLIEAMETLPEDGILAEVQTHAADMLKKANGLKQAMGRKDDLPPDLLRRARDLLRGVLTS